MAQTPVGGPTPIAERGDTVYRAALDADLVAKLDERVQRDGLRDRAAGLCAPLSSHALAKWNMQLGGS